MHEARPGDALKLATDQSAIQALDQRLLEQHAPAMHFSLLADGQLVARCSIWTESTPHCLNEPVGVIGHYAAEGVQAGVAVLKHACDHLSQLGFQKFVGPMDGSSWRRYRLLTERGTEPPFFLEPDNPDDWPRHFLSAGFTPLSDYYSALNTELASRDPRVPEALARVRDAGITIRPIDMSRFAEELAAVHELSCEAFSSNFLYTPISQAEFLAMYAPLRPHIRPELVLLAEQHGKLIGFMFGIPDLAQAQRGELINTAIAKSMAVRPGRSGAGLGSVLLDLFHQAAQDLSYTRVIHALMHQSNRSRKISARSGKSFRQYTLYARGICV